MLNSLSADASAGLAFSQNDPCVILLGEQNEKDARCQTTRASHHAWPSSILWIVTNESYGSPPAL
jgi:hypothetical protein